MQVISVEGNKVVFLPCSVVGVALPVSEGAVTMDEVALEPALYHFPVRQNQPTCALLAVLPELSLVTHPVTLHFVEISTIEGTLEGQWIFVVKNTLSMEFAVCPHSVVGWSALAVVENATATNLSLLKLPLVIGPVSKQELAPSVLLASQQLPLIGPSLLVQPLKELYLLQTVPHPPGLHLVLPLKEALFASLEVLQTILECKFWQGWCRGRGGVSGRGEFEVADGVEDGLRLGVEEGVFDGLLEGALLELADVLQVLPDHLKQPWVGVDVLLLLLDLPGQSVLGKGLLPVS